MNDGRRLEAAAAWAYSSVVEHCVDIAGVASSNLATPTIFPIGIEPALAGRLAAKPVICCALKIALSRASGGPTCGCWWLKDNK